MSDIQENIRFTINQNNIRIEELMCPGIFTLNKEIEHLIQQNATLRENCHHEFTDGICKWCDIPEEML